MPGYQGGDTITAQCKEMTAITKNDTVPITQPHKGLWIGTAGTLIITTVGDPTNAKTVTVTQGVFPNVGVYLVKTGGTVTEAWVMT